MKLWLSLVACMLVLGFCITPARSQDNPKSEDAKVKSVTFKVELSKGDKKDNDTGVSVWVKKGDTLIASKEKFAGDEEWKVPSTHSYDLEVKSAVKKSEFRSGKTTFTIYPNGHNRVIVKLIIEAKFDDGDTLQHDSGNTVTVDQDNPTADFKNGG